MYSTIHLCKKYENTLYMSKKFLKIHHMPLSEFLKVYLLLYF